MDDHKVEGQNVCCRQWCFFAHEGAKFSLSLRRTRRTIRNTIHNLEIETANGTVRSAKEARVYIQELGTHLYMKLVEDSVSVFFFRSTDISVPLVAVIQQKFFRLPDTTPPGKPCVRCRSEGNKG